MGIKIDSREAKLIECFAAMPYVVSIEQLPVADAIIENSSGRAVALLERKTFSDFCSSLTSGRYKEQRDRLISVRANDPGSTQLAYILEGFPQWHTKLRRDAMLQKRVYGALENLVFKHKIAFYPTNDVEHTCLTLKHLAVKLTDVDASYPIPTSAPLPARKVTIKAQLFPSQLALIPGISNTSAISIAPLYGSAASLVQAIQGDRDAVLAHLASHCPNRRKLGKTAAAAIVDAFS